MSTSLSSKQTNTVINNAVQSSAGSINEGGIIYDAIYKTLDNYKGSLPSILYQKLNNPSNFFWPRFHKQVQLVQRLL